MAFTSGDSFLTAYLEEFNDQKWSIICAEIIITAAHFANTIHKDSSCLFDGESDNLKDLLSKDQQWKTYLCRFDSIFPDEKYYLLLDNEGECGKLPNATVFLLSGGWNLL